MKRDPFFFFQLIYLPSCKLRLALDWPLVWPQQWPQLFSSCCWSFTITKEVIVDSNNLLKRKNEIFSSQLCTNTCRARGRETSIYRGRVMAASASEAAGVSGLANVYKCAKIPRPQYHLLSSPASLANQYKDDIRATFSDMMTHRWRWCHDTQRKVLPDFPICFHK